MKQKDIALIIVVVFISAIVSLVVSKFLFASKNRQQQVEVVQPISADFASPDKRYFNDKSFDPTELITIGNNTNPHPFSSKK